MLEVTFWANSRRSELLSRRAKFLSEPLTFLFIWRQFNSGSEDFFQPSQLWAAEQVLRSGSCGALLFWQHQIRAENQRRLTLAAQEGETLFFMIRLFASAQDPSPALLRLALRRRPGGRVREKTRAQRDEPLFLPMRIDPAHCLQPQRQVTPAYPVAEPALQQ